MARFFNIILNSLIPFVASIFTIILAYQTWCGPASPDGRFALKIFSIFIAVLIVVLVTQEFRYSRKARYSESLGDLNRIFREIQATACNPEATVDHIKLSCKSIVDCLSSVFSLITGTRCAVCIKGIEWDPNQPEGANIRPKVFTLTRDAKSEEREERAQNIDHWIDQNTDFEQLHAETLPYFFSNYLPGIRGYKNTSFKIYKPPWDLNIPIFSDIVRDITWRLPYKSTIVMPISRRDTPPDGQRLVGYLCLDSRSRRAFNRRYDIDLLKGVSDCLYDLVLRYREILWASREGRN